MFEIFKKKKIYQFSDREINFFREVIKLLPTRYHYILNQLNREFLISFKPNNLNFLNWYSIQMNAKLEDNYNNLRLGYFQLQGIFILNKKSKKKEKVILSFFEGMFIGFFIEDIKFDNFILNEYDTSHLKEKHFKNENDKNVLLEILKNLSKDRKSRLDIESTFKIEIPEGIFYTIKDLNDGNYLVVNNKGEVYKIVHDPYSVKKLADSIVDFEI